MHFPDDGLYVLQDMIYYQNQKDWEAVNAFFNLGELRVLVNRVGNLAAYTIHDMAMALFCCDSYYIHKASGKQTVKKKQVADRIAAVLQVDTDHDGQWPIEKPMLELQQVGFRLETSVIGSIQLPLKGKRVRVKARQSEAQEKAYQEAQTRRSKDASQIATRIRRSARSVE